MSEDPAKYDARPTAAERKRIQERQDKNRERWIYLEDDGKMGILKRPSFFDKTSAEDSDLYCPYDSDKSNPGKCGSWCALFALGLDAWDSPRVTLCNGREIPVYVLECGSAPWLEYNANENNRGNFTPGFLTSKKTGRT